MIKRIYREFPRPNKYPILVRVQSPLLLYVFYENHGRVYYGEKYGTYYGQQPKKSEEFEYSQPLNEEIEMVTKGAGGKVIRYNEKTEETYIHDDSPPSVFKNQKHPIAYTNEIGDIILIYKNHAEHFTVKGPCYHTTFSDLAKEMRQKKYYSFQEVDMLKDNGYKLLGE